MAANNTLNNYSSTFTSGNGITATTGDIVASAGNISTTLGSITSQVNLTATTGDVVITAGKLQVGALTGNNGDILIGATAAAPAWAALTMGTGMAKTVGANSLTLDVIGGGWKWLTATGNVSPMVASTAYVTKHATPANKVTYTLPATAALGDTFKVQGYTSGGWRIAQNANQQIFFGDKATTIGAGGYLEFTNQYDSVELVCVTANLEFAVLEAVGNITYA